MIARFYLESRPGEEGAVLQLPVSRLNINVNPKPVVVETDIATAELVQVKLGWCLVFRLTPPAVRDFYRMSVGAQGRRLVLTLNGQPIGARRFDQAIADGGLLMFLEVLDTDLPVIADRVRQTSESLAAHAKH